MSTVELGCDLDSPPREQPVGTHRWARNMQPNRKKGRSGGKVNEGSTIRRADIPGYVYLGKMPVEERNATLIFHMEGDASVLSFFYHDTYEVKEIVRDTDFECKWAFKECMWVGYGYNGNKTLAPCNDLIVYWSSDDYYRVVNVDEMLDDKRKEAVKELENVCEHFQLIKPISGPRVKLRPMRGGGKDLAPGQYYALARFKDESNNTSNWTPIMGPVYIGSRYNLPGENSRQAIRVEVSNMNKNYSRVEIAIVPPVGSQEQDVAYSIYDGVYNTNGVSVVYYSSSQHKATYTIAQILAKDIKWIRGQKMFINEGRLNLYKLRQPFNFNGQKHANKIKVIFQAYLVPADKAHLFKSLPRDEPIPFGIGYKGIDQIIPTFFHIRGEEGGSNDLTCGCDLPKGHTSNNSRITKEYFSITGDGNTLCFTSGQTTTSNPKTSDVYDPPSKCYVPGEEPIIPREDTGGDCNTDEKVNREIDDEVSAFTSDNDSLDNCLQCPPDSVRQDLDHVENVAVRGLEKITDLFRTDKEVYEDCTIGKHSKIPAASHDAYTKGIEDAEKDEEVEYRTIIEKKSGTDLKLKEGEGDSAKAPSRKIVKADDCGIEDVVPILWREYSPASWESRLTYPKTKDCEGNYFHEERAGKPITHPKTPGCDICPLFVSAQSGVDSRFDPSNIPGKRDTYAVILGVKFTGIYIPTDDEVFTPLDKNEPARIGVVPPQAHNKSTLYHGYFTHTFGGKVGGKTYALARHAANSFPAVDRNIDDNGSRKGFDWDKPLYTFHTPDLNSGSAFMLGDYVKIEGFLSGEGLVYGQYAKGKAVKEEENRRDRRGSRGALNLGKFTPNTFYTCLKGIEIAEHNSTLQNPEGISDPLLNKHRESCVYLETESPLPALPGGNKDRSFTGGGLDHEYPITGEVWYGTVKRFNTEQYGSVEALQYADLGLGIRYGQTSVEGPVGTCFVQKWSDKRSSFISDKQGNYLNEDLREQFPAIATEEFLGPPEARKRGVPDPPNRRGYRMKEYLGFWNSQELPRTGDKRDPKNMANLHPTMSAAQIASVTEAQTDLYYPRTHVHLNHLMVQSDVNLYYRSTNDPATREVYYENLEGLGVDSSITGEDPEDCWLNDFHAEHLQPSDKQQETKIRIRVFLGLIMPYILMVGFAGMSTEIETTATVIAAPGLLLLWGLALNNIFTSKKIDQFKGIPRARMDKEGGQEHDRVKGLKDNWMSYNWGFSALNDLNVYIGQPHPYVTCKCLKYSNDIRSSNMQLHGSPYDAWGNFQALSLMGLDGTSGSLELVVVWNNQVIAHTTDGAYPLQIKNTTIPTSSGEQLLGGPKYLPNPPRLRDGAFEGYAGTQDPNAGIIFEKGYASIDYEKRAIYLFAGGDFVKLNDEKSGLYQYFFNNFELCSSECRDMKSPKGAHFSMGYDPERGFLMITKHDSDPWTWSFDLNTNRFNSYHDYAPEDYFWDRNKMFSIKEGVIWEHNSGDSFCNFYGKQYSASIEIPVRTKDSVPFVFRNGILDTEARQGALKDRELTFSSMYAYNDFQTSGRLPIKVTEKDNTRSTIINDPDLKVDRSLIGMWQFDKIRANEWNRDVPVILDKKCGQPPELNTDNVSFNKNFVNNMEVRSKFLIFNFELGAQEAAGTELVVKRLITDVEVHDLLRSSPA